MWKANLNRHFQKIWPALKISGFLILWNAIFHSFSLSILLMWSLTSSSNQASSMTRMTNLNNFLSENQILFATLGSGFALVFFQNSLIELWRNRHLGLPLMARGSVRGIGFAVAILTALVLNQDYQFLGFTTQIGINFLVAYAWIFRAILVFLFIFSTEFLVRIVVRSVIPDSIWSKFFIENFTLLAMYWIWFGPTPKELFTLFLLLSVFTTFWSSVGFLASFFVLIHAICGLNFFQNEFTGIFQLKIPQNEETLFQNDSFQAMLALILILIYTAKWKMRKETRTA